MVSQVERSAAIKKKVKGECVLNINIHRINEAENTKLRASASYDLFGVLSKENNPGITGKRRKKLLVIIGYRWGDPGTLNIFKPSSHESYIVHKGVCP